MTHPDDRDPNLRAAIERALEPYRDLLPSAELTEIQELLTEELALHPVSLRLLRQLAPPPVVHASGERGTGAAEEEELATRPAAGHDHRRR